MSTKIDLKKLTQLTKAKGDPKTNDLPPNGGKRIRIGEKSSKRAQDDALDISPLTRKRPLLKPEDKKKGPLPNSM